MRLKIVLIIFIFTSPFMLFSQDTNTPPLFPEDFGWEEKVETPPPDAWIKHMPPGYIHEALPVHTVRSAYIIPSNRKTQDSAIEKP